MSSFELGPFVNGKAFIYSEQPSVRLIGVNGQLYEVKPFQRFCINTKGEVLFSLEEHQICHAYLKSDVALVHLSHQTALIDRDGHFLTPFYDDMFDFCDGRYFKVEKDSRSGLINAHGEMILPCIYDEIEHLSEKTRVLSYQGMVGVMDQNHQLFIPFEYESMKDSSQGYFAAKKDGKWGVIDHQNRVHIDFTFEDLYFNAPNRCQAFVAKRNQKWGFINHQGETIEPFVFDEIYPCFEGDGSIQDDYCLVKKENQWALYSLVLAKFSTDFRYEALGHVNEEGLLKARLLNQEGMINIKGDVVVSLTYDRIDDYFHDGLARVRLGKKRGMVNTHGELIIPIQYEKLSICQFGLICAQKGNERGIMDMNHEIVIPFGKYQNIRRFLSSTLEDDYFAVYNQGKSYYVNRFGKEIHLQMQKIL